MKYQFLAAILTGVVAGQHVNYYDDTNCGHWIGYQPLSDYDWSEHKYYAPKNARSAVGVDLNGVFRIDYFKTNNEDEVAKDYQKGCWWSDRPFGFKSYPW
ncbi:hypothetical protein F4779DRAFT_102659 [Xylariaceae sp. FL0662B]|nr:hypothetical protein F4779DRAFT_102659 [Xylariaceae sp. FL0662B]